MIRPCTLNLRIWPSDLDFAGWLPFRKIVLGYDFWIRRVTYCCYLHIVAAGELCCLSDILLFNYYLYIVMIVLYIFRYWTCLWSSCGIIIGCQPDSIPDSFPLTSRPLIKVYIILYITLLVNYQGPKIKCVFLFITPITTTTTNRGQVSRIKFLLAVIAYYMYIQFRCVCLSCILIKCQCLNDILTMINYVA